ncbi:hypothetical protein [Candidatus Amarobacter glycogenicus]|uniref:hypothetical protein n=1 Tax=Candidatus Amarobacter glycogenicus TaxID=3140699 RepID=UPI0031CCA7DB
MSWRRSRSRRTWWWLRHSRRWSRAGLTAADLDLIIVATDTPDYLSPATASVVQRQTQRDQRRRLRRQLCVAAWVTALDIGSRYIATDTNYRHILVVGAYGMTRFLDWHDKQTGTLFADGAGAVILGAGEQPGFLGGKLLAMGEFHDAWASTPAAPSARPRLRWSTRRASRGCSSCANSQPPSTASAGRR